MNLSKIVLQRHQLWGTEAITPLLAVLIVPSTTQGETKQHKRGKLLSRREAVVGLIGLVGGIAVGAGTITSCSPLR